MSSPFGSPFGGVTKHPTRAVLALPRTNLLAYFRGGVGTIGESTMLLDQSGNGRHMTVVSGTSWADFVLTAPADDAAWIAADTSNRFYDGAGDPIEIAAAEIQRIGVGPQLFATDQQFAYYDAPQLSATAQRINRALRGDASTAFVFVMRTTGAAETITIPATGSNNFVIDWGDGSSETVTTASPTHEYAVAGDYTISITGTCPWFSFNNGGDRVKLISVFSLGRVELRSLAGAFYGCSNLIWFYGGDCDTSLVTSMSYMFHSCSSATVIDVSGFDTSLVTNMGEMFNGCSSVTVIDVSRFDTSRVTDMGYMFHSCSSVTVIDVSGFDTSLVTNMQAMFHSCSSVTVIDVSGFDTSLVTDMGSMFRACSSVTVIDVSGFDTSSVTNMSYMFYRCSAATVIDVSGFDTSLVTNMIAMFDSCSSVTVIDVSGFDTSLVTNMEYMFSNCGISTESYSVALITFANNVVTDDGPYNINMSNQNGMTYNDTTHGSGPYLDAVSARAFLVAATPGGAGWTITGDAEV